MPRSPGIVDQPPASILDARQDDAQLARAGDDGRRARWRRMRP